jgi:(methylthio)acryloyl-CoA hydratase
MASDRIAMTLPASLRAERQADVAVLRLNRAQKRNALDDDTVIGIDKFFTTLPDGVRAVLLVGEGEHFSAGLDLNELEERDVAQGIAHSSLWHRAFAERSAYYALPEGSRGIYVGGGGSVRLPRLIGVARMMDMMLTGRTYSAEEGQSMGLTTYLVEDGKGFAKGLELATRIAGNTALTNFAVMHALPRIAESDPASGYAMEALMAAIAQGDGEAKIRLKDFLEKRGPKVKRS